MKLHNADHLGYLIGGVAGDIREFPYREKIAVDLDFLPGVSFAAHREFPHCKKNSGGWEVSCKLFTVGKSKVPRWRIFMGVLEL